MPYVNTITHLVESADGPPVPQMNTFDLRQHWHVFLAYGPIYEGNVISWKTESIQLKFEYYEYFENVYRYNAISLQDLKCYMCLGWFAGKSEL